MNFGLKVTLCACHFDRHWTFRAISGTIIGPKCRNRLHGDAYFDYGRLSGEHEALCTVSRYDVIAFVLLVLMLPAGMPVEGVDRLALQERR